jgi:hypothetical protein
MNRVKHLEAVTVCVGYADFLAETAKWNVPLFERWIIVTEPGDTETREVCRRFNLECVLSEDGKRHGSPFNKGRMVERGMQHTSSEGWRLHIDADIALPHRFRQMLEISDPQEDMIYGIDRVMVHGWESWQKLLSTGYLQSGQYDYHCYVGFPKGYPLGTRWVHTQMGYVPIGFFQLFHSSQDEWRGVRVKPYPVQHGNACRSDVQMGLRWDRHKRALLPEIVGVHLDSEDTQRGANWNGRKTCRFGPEKKK